MPLELNRKTDCCGCGACYQICPVHCITMKEDDCGFLYPAINHSTCIKCEACIRVCPELSQLETNNSEKPPAFAAWSKEEGLRYTSTSGGLFTELAREILSENGFAAAAKYNDKNLVEHTMVDNPEDLEKLKQSKYVQSDTKQIYKQIKEKLKSGNKVLFCGAPCHAAALRNYLGKDYENLLILDFICRGVNSPKAYLAWLREIEAEHKSKVSRVWFKYKQNGWKKSPKCTRIDFSNGTSKVYTDDKNLFMTGYLDHNLYIRPSCGDCRYKGVPRQSDITLADFWGVDETCDDDQGTSMVLINSEKGMTYFQKTKNRLMALEKDFNEIFSGNMCFADSVKINPKSEEFLQKLDDGPFSELIEKYSRDCLAERFAKKCKGMIKMVLIKLHLYGWYRRIRGISS